MTAHAYGGASYTGFAKPPSAQRTGRNSGQRRDMVGMDGKDRQLYWRPH